MGCFLQWMSMTEDTAKYLVFHPVGVIHLYPQEASPRRPIRRYQKTLPRQTSGLLPGHYPPGWKAPHAPVEICLPHKDMAKTWHKAYLHLRARPLLITAPCFSCSDDQKIRSSPRSPHSIVTCGVHAYRTEETGVNY